MKLNTYLYTKVPPEKSPIQKSGFQMVYKPAFITSKMGTELEAYIHFPGDKVAQKVTAFYFKFEDEPQLVIQLMRALPEEKDEFGRGGLFIAQGFIFPVGYAQKTLNPYANYNELWQYVPQSVSEVLAYQLGDLATGQMQSIDFEPKAELASINTSLASVFYQYSQGKHVTVGLAASANSAVDQFIEAAQLVPPTLRDKLAWDTSLENGKLFFFPCKIIAYQHSNPTLGDTYIIGNSNPLAPIDAYDKWLASDLANLPQPEQLDQLLQFSNYLAGKGKRPRYFEPETSFISVNEKAIQAFAINYINETFGIVWKTHSQAPIETSLALSICLASDQELALLLESIILSVPVLPSNKLTLPGNYHTPILEKIDWVWQGNELGEEALASLKKDDQSKLLRYLTNTAYLMKPWCLSLIKLDNEVLAELPKQPGFRKSLPELLSKYLPKELTPLADGMAEIIITTKLLKPMLEEALDYFVVLEEHLAKAPPTQTLLKDILKHIPASSNTEGYPTLHALVNAKALPTQNIMLGQEYRNLYLGILIQHFKLGKAEIRSKGFSGKEIKQWHADNPGLVKRILKQLGF